MVALPLPLCGNAEEAGVKWELGLIVGTLPSGRDRPSEKHIRLNNCYRLHRLTIFFWGLEKQGRGRRKGIFRGFQLRQRACGRSCEAMSSIVPERSRRHRTRRACIWIWHIRSEELQFQELQLIMSDLDSHAPQMASSSCRTYRCFQILVILSPCQHTQLGPVWDVVPNYTTSIPHTGSRVVGKGLGKVRFIYVASKRRCSSLLSRSQRLPPCVDSTGSERCLATAMRWSSVSMIL